MSERYGGSCDWRDTPVIKKSELSNEQKTMRNTRAYFKHRSVTVKPQVKENSKNVEGAGEIFKAYGGPRTGDASPNATTANQGNWFDEMYQIILTAPNRREQEMELNALEARIRSAGLVGAPHPLGTRTRAKKVERRGPTAASAHKSVRPGDIFKSYGR